MKKLWRMTTHGVHGSGSNIIGKSSSHSNLRRNGSGGAAESGTAASSLMKRGVSTSGDDLSPEDLAELKTSLRSRILHDLAQSSLTEKAVWEGDPRVFTILQSYKRTISVDQSLAGASVRLPATMPTGSYVVTFQVHKVCLSENQAPIRPRAFKISACVPIVQVVYMVCRKMKIANPEDISLCTLRDHVLVNQESLSTYGLGTLYETWSLILKTNMEANSPQTEAVQSLTRKVTMFTADTPLKPMDEGTRARRAQFRKSVRLSTNISAAGLGAAAETGGVTSFLVNVKLPQVPAFAGLQQKVIRITTSTTIRQIVATICRRYKVSNPVSFALSTYSPRRKIGLILDPHRTTAFYGLGGAFEKWQITLHHIGVYQINSEIPPISSLSIARCQETIQDLENEVHIYDTELTLTRRTRDRLQDSLQEAEADIVNSLKRVATLHAHRTQLGEQITEVSAFLKEVTACLRAEKDNVAELENDLAQSREGNANLTTKLVSRDETISNLDSELASTRDQLAKAEGDLEQTLADSEAQRARFLSEIEANAEEAKNRASGWKKDHAALQAQMNERLNAEQAEAASAKEAWESERTKLLESLREEQASNAELRATEERLTQSLAASQDELRDRGERMASLRAAKQVSDMRSKERIGDLESSLEAVKSQLQDQQNQTCSLQGSLLEASERGENVSERYSELQAVSTSLQTTLKETRAVKAQLEKDLSAKRKQYDNDMHEMREMLESHKVQSEGEKKRLNERIEAMIVNYSKERNETQQNGRDLTDELQKTKASLQDEQGGRARENADAARVAASLNAKIGDLTHQLEAAQSLASTTATEKRAIEELLASMTAARDNLLAKHTKAVEDAKNAIKALNADVVRVNREKDEAVADYTTRLNKSQETLTAVEKAKKALEGDLSASRKSVDTLGAQLKASMGENEEITSLFTASQVLARELEETRRVRTDELLSANEQIRLLSAQRSGNGVVTAIDTPKIQPPKPAPVAPALPTTDLMAPASASSSSADTSSSSSSAKTASGWGVASTRHQDRTSGPRMGQRDLQSELRERKGALKAMEKDTRPRGRDPDDLVDLLYTSLQARFNSLQTLEVEDLDFDEENMFDVDSDEEEEFSLRRDKGW